MPQPTDPHFRTLASPGTPVPATEPAPALAPAPGIPAPLPAVSPGGQAGNGERAGFRLLYVDEWIIIADKASGLLSVPGRGPDKQDSLGLRVAAEFADALMVHRLDMNTSGLLVIARGAEMHSRLSRMFRERRIDKEYVALVDGLPAEASGEIDLPLAADWERRPRQRVDLVNGKPSLTRYRVVDYDRERDVARVELRPKTGRSHQLRVHLQSLGHPIIGDGFYAGEAARAKSERLCLHASRLAFSHPQHGQWLEFASAAPF